MGIGSGGPLRTTGSQLRFRRWSPSPWATVTNTFATRRAALEAGVLPQGTLLGPDPPLDPRIKGGHSVDTRRPMMWIPPFLPIGSQCGPTDGYGMYLPAYLDLAAANSASIKGGGQLPMRTTRRVQK